jgi:hypothetical protein
MPNPFPCPNAQCTYQFDADMLPPAAMVTCPLCRTRFPYRANQPVTTAAGTGGPVADEPVSAGPRVIQLRDAPKSNVWLTVGAVGAFVLVLVAILVGLNSRGRLPGGDTQEQTDQKVNVRVDPFPPGWEEDAAVRRPMDANVIGRKRSNPDGFVAVVARDWEDRQPRTGELEELLRTRLRGGLSTLEVEPVEGQTWADQPALALRFSGNMDEEHVRGEAYAMAYKGIGYVYFAWANESNWAGLRDELVALREKVRPARYRENWAPKRANTETYSPEGAAYKVEDVDGVWILGKPADQWGPKERKYIVEDPKDLDPRATLALRAEYQIRERGDAKRKPAEAFALVVELDKAGDPLEAVKDHVIERIKRDYAGTPPEIKLDPLPRSPSGVPLPTGGPAIIRLLFNDPLDKDNRWVWVLSATKVGGKVVGVEARTPERSASYVDEWMVHLAGSLRGK